MNLTTEHKGGVTVVRVGEARMMYPLLADFTGVVAQLLASGDKRVLLDFSKVTYVDSATIGCLMDLYRQTTAAGGAASRHPGAVVSGNCRPGRPAGRHREVPHQPGSHRTGAPDSPSAR